MKIDRFNHSFPQQSDSEPGNKPDFICALSLGHTPRKKFKINQFITYLSKVYIFGFIRTSPVWTKCY